jgi:hypothetical protein
VYGGQVFRAASVADIIISTSLRGGRAFLDGSAHGRNEWGSGHGGRQFSTDAFPHVIPQTATQRAQASKPEPALPYPLMASEALSVATTTQTPSPL